MIELLSLTDSHAQLEWVRVLIGRIKPIMVTINEQARRPRAIQSVAVSSNLHPSGFDELMPKTLATAAVDRFLHHAHPCRPAATRTGSPNP